MWASLESKVEESAQKKKIEEEKKNNWITPRKIKNEESVTPISRYVTRINFVYL